MKYVFYRERLVRLDVEVGERRLGNEREEKRSFVIF
jgi:hypothetical protein